jgi:hypothetical protein
MVYEYEIQLRCKEGPLKGQIFTTTEYAYNINDAMLQAIVMKTNERPDCSFDIFKMGPASRLVQAAAVQVQNTIDAIMAKVKMR